MSVFVRRGGGGVGGEGEFLDGLKRNKVRLSNRRLICTMRLPGARDKVVIENLFTFFKFAFKNGKLTPSYWNGYVKIRCCNCGPLSYFFHDSFVTNRVGRFKKS